MEISRKSLEPFKAIVIFRFLRAYSEELFKRGYHKRDSGVSNTTN